MKASTSSSSELPAGARLFGIVGRGVERSPSPRLHNAAYHVLGLPHLYRAFPAESFDELWRSLAAEDLTRLGGLTVVAPLKEAAVELAGPEGSSGIVRRAGAANLLVRAGETAWKADSTDPQGVLDPLRRRRVALRDRALAVIGCGGSGRAVAAALDGAGARVTMVNRGRERGEEAARRLGLPFVPLADFDARGFAAVVHATPAGRDGRQIPFEVDGLDPGAVVVDLVLAPGPTPLVRAARARGLRVIDGREVLLAQTDHQIRAMTGRRVPLRRLRSFLEAPPAGDRIRPARSP